MNGRIQPREFLLRTSPFCFQRLNHLIDIGHSFLPFTLSARYTSGQAADGEESLQYGTRKQDFSRHIRLCSGWLERQLLIGGADVSRLRQKALSVRAPFSQDVDLSAKGTHLSNPCRKLFVLL